MFIDEAFILVKAGDGGNGCMSFRREKFVRFGGPDGGDGGRGGNIVVEAAPALKTLLDFRYKSRFKADRGEHGKGKNMIGKQGEDLILPVPVGTVVRDKQTGEMLADLSKPFDRIVAARGGRGGRGNARFADAVKKAPKFAEKGEAGEQRELRFELKLLADVGIIGFPNAGKSTLLSRISAAHPKIADYPFTTLTPQLGVVSLYGKQAVFADLPGLIEGAHQGAGLGIKFLKHIERTRLLLHLIDLAEVDPAHPVDRVDSIQNELASFNARLRQIPQIYAGNKLDLPSARVKAPEIARAFASRGDKLLFISAATGEGLRELLRTVFEMLDALSKAPEAEKPDPAPPEGRTFSRTGACEVERETDHFRVRGKEVERSVSMTDLGNDEAVFHLQKILSRYGVETKLRKLGIQKGDLVKIGDFEFYYENEKKTFPKKTRHSK